MKKYIVILAVLTVLIAGSWTALALFSPGRPGGTATTLAGPHTHGATGTTTLDATTTATSPDASADASTDPGHGAGHDGAPAATGAPTSHELMFATMMLDHHQQALDMGEILAQADEVPTRVANLAARIQVAQTSEIGDSKSWLAAWTAADPASAAVLADPAAEHMTMRGMIGEEGFARLRSAQGREAARVYLELMIEHHEGAIEAAGAIFPTVSNPWVVSFARHIVNEQTVEVDGMRRMLASLSD